MHLESKLDSKPVLLIEAIQLDSHYHRHLAHMPFFNVEKTVMINITSNHSVLSQLSAM